MNCPLLRHRIVAVPRGRRSGAVLLELLIALPVLLLGLFAVVEFGLWMSAQERIEMAARMGAEAASKTPHLETLTSLAGSSIQTKIYRYLEDESIPTANVRITLAHNVGGGGMLAFPPGDIRPAALGENAPAQLPLARAYVRLVVSVPSEDLTPNLLKFWGFDLGGLPTRHSKTYRYER